MKKLVLLSLAGLLLVPAWARASTLSVLGSGGTAAVVFEGAVTYQPVALTLEGTIISKDQTALVFILTATYSSGDLDFNGNGFRWTENITNNSGVSWSSYSLVLGTNGTYFSDLPYFSPTFVTVAGSTATATAVPGTLTLSADRKRIDLVFASAIAPGGSFSIHTPVEGLTSSGSFVVTETAEAVPEPATLGLLGLGLLGLAVRLRARKA